MYKIRIKRAQEGALLPNEETEKVRSDMTERNVSTKLAEMSRHT